MNPILISVGFVLLASLCFTTGVTLVKMVSTEAASVMILFLRCFFGFTLFLPFALRKGTKNLKTTRLPLHMLRVLFIGGSLVCTYYVYRHLPIATASAIGFTGPLFTTLFAYFFLKEHLHFKKWVVIIAGYLGVLVIFQDFSFTSGLDVGMALLANLLAAGAIILAKKLLTTESTTTLVFYTTFATFVLATCAAAGVWQLPALRDILLIAGVALSGVLANVLGVQALKYGKASLVAPLEYTRLIFAVVLGYLIFQETPQMNVLLGGAIIALSTYLLTRMEMKEPAAIPASAS